MAFNVLLKYCLFVVYYKFVPSVKIIYSSRGYALSIESMQKLSRKWLTIKHKCSAVCGVGADSQWHAFLQVCCGV